MNADKYSIPQFLTRKVRGLIIPYLSFGTLYMLYRFIIIEYSPHECFAQIRNLLSINYDCAAFWFLTALFWCELILFLLLKFIKREAIIALITIALTLVGLGWNSLCSFRLPLSLDAAFACVGFLYLGYIFKNKWLDKFTRTWKYSSLGIKTKVVIITIAIFNCFSIMLSDYVNFRTGEYGSIPFITYFNAFLKFVSLFGLLLMIKQKRGGISKLLRLIEQVGKNSIVYLCLNQAIIVTVHLIFEPYCSTDFELLVERGFTFLAVIIVCTIFTMLSEHFVVLRFVLGKSVSRSPNP